MRLPEADVAMIDHAAALRGRSRTGFVRDVAVRAAEDVVMKNRLIASRGRIRRFHGLLRHALTERKREGSLI